MILGTAAYMAPEQARGKPVDKRADIWAFGVVLFEMLTGTRAFDGEDTTEVLGAVVRLEPNYSALPADVPAPVRTLLQSCLVKDPRRRVADISTALFVLDKAASLAPPAATSVTAAPPVAPRTGTAWIVAAVAVFAAAALAVPALRHLRETPPSEPPLMRFTIPLPDGIALTSAPRISPDGTRVVLAGAAVGIGGGALYVRPLEAPGRAASPGDRGGDRPVLVARRQEPRLLRGRQAQEDRRRGRSCRDALRRADGSGWRLEPNGRDRVRTQQRRRAAARVGRGRDAGTGHGARPGSPGALAPLAAVPPRWRALLVLQPSLGGIGLRHERHLRHVVGFEDEHIARVNRQSSGVRLWRAAVHARHHVDAPALRDDGAPIDGRPRVRRRGHHEPLVRTPHCFRCPTLGCWCSRPGGPQSTVGWSGSIAGAASRRWGWRRAPTTARRSRPTAGRLSSSCATTPGPTCGCMTSPGGRSANARSTAATTSSPSGRATGRL